jgi:hypothetical protein
MTQHYVVIPLPHVPRTHPNIMRICRTAERARTSGPVVLRPLRTASSSSYPRPHRRPPRQKGSEMGPAKVSRCKKTRQPANTQGPRFSVTPSPLRAAPHHSPAPKTRRALSVNVGDPPPTVTQQPPHQFHPNLYPPQ